MGRSRARRSMGTSRVRRSMGTSTARRSGPMRWLPGVMLALICVAVPAAVPTAASAAHRFAAAQATSLSLSATPALIDYGGSTTLAGQFSTTSGPVAGVALELASSTDGTTWSQPTAVTTDASGQFSTQVTPDEAHTRTLYQVSFAGSADLAPAEAQIGVDSRPDLVAPRRPLERRPHEHLSGRWSAAPPARRRPPARGAGLLPAREGKLGPAPDRGGDSRRPGERLTVRGAARPCVAGDVAPARRLRRGRPRRDLVVVERNDDGHRRAGCPNLGSRRRRTIPERMASRLNARQLIVVTAPRLGSRDGTLRLFDYRDGDWVRTLAVPTRLGPWADRRAQAAGRLTHDADRHLAPAGLRLRHAPATADGLALGVPAHHARSWWSAEPGATYNTWVETARTVDGERLADHPVTVRVRLLERLQRTSQPLRVRPGTAIFVHVFDPGYTRGCVSVSRADMIRLLRLLDHSRRPACAIGTMRSGTRTCIFAY